MKRDETGQFVGGGPLTRVRKTDVLVVGHGSVVMVHPVTRKAKGWVDEHVELEGWQWMGGGFACEPRMVDNLVEGMQGDGLVVR